MKRCKMKVDNTARHGLIFLLAIGMSGPSWAASRAAQSVFRPAIAIEERPTIEHFYGGALHNDLYPAPGDRPFAFGQALFVKAKGQYLEVDLFVPEYILTDKRMAAEPWFASFEEGIKAGDSLLIRRSERSYIIVFPVTSRPASPP